MDPWEQLIKTINGTTYDPVTKTPINIQNGYLPLDKLGPEEKNKYMSLLREVSGGVPVTGQYRPDKQSIDITINPWATYEDYRKTLVHEKMHEAMNVAAPGKTMAPYPEGKQPGEVVADYLARLLSFNTPYAPGPTETQPRKNVFGQRLTFFGLEDREPVPDTVYPTAKNDSERRLAAKEKFKSANMVGFTPIEYPTYMMSTPHLLPNVTPEQSDEYTRRYVRQLPVKVGKRVADIRNQMSAPLPRTLADLLGSGNKK